MTTENTPKILVSQDDKYLYIEDRLLNRNIALTIEQAKELKLALDVMYDEWYKQEEK